MSRYRPRQAQDLRSILRRKVLVVFVPNRSSFHSNATGKPTSVERALCCEEALSHPITTAQRMNGVTRCRAGSSGGVKWDKMGGVADLLAGRDLAFPLFCFSLRTGKEGGVREYRRWLSIFLAVSGSTLHPHTLKAQDASNTPMHACTLLGCGGDSFNISLRSIAGMLLGFIRALHSKLTDVL